MQIPKQEVKSSNRIYILNNRLIFILDYHQKDITHSKTKTIVGNTHISKNIHMESSYMLLCSSSSGLVSMEEPPLGHDSCFQLAPLALKSFYFHLSFYFQTSWLGTLVLVLFCLLPKTTNQYHPHFYYILFYPSPSQKPRPLACWAEIYAHIYSFGMYLVGIYLVQYHMLVLGGGQWVMQILLGQKVSY